MSENVYDRFADGEIKVFATKKEEKPHKMSGKIIRKLFPLVASSIVMLSSIGCSTRKENVDNDGFVDSVTLTTDEIIDMMLSPKNVYVKDFDYNHEPESPDNYWKVVNQGLLIIKDLSENSNLSQDEIYKYKETACKMLAKVKIIDDSITTPNLSDPETLKTFLFFEKVVKYTDNYDAIFGDETGVYNEQDRLVGKYYKDCYELMEKAQNSVGVNKFAKALYEHSNRFLIQQKDTAFANHISRFILKEWLKNNDVSDGNLYKSVDADAGELTNAVSFYYKPGKDFNMELKIDTKGNLGDGCYSPVGVNVIHELLHIAQKKPSSAQDVNEKNVLIEELGPTLNSLMLEDMIYKTIHKIPMNNVVKYGDLNIGKSKYPIGELAVWFRKMTEKHPEMSIDKLLCQDEVFNTIEKMGKGEKVVLVNSPIISNNRDM